jgi:hypothetical protein
MFQCCFQRGDMVILVLLNDDDVDVLMGLETWRGTELVP